LGRVKILEKLIETKFKTSLGTVSNKGRKPSLEESVGSLLLADSRDCTQETLILRWVDLLGSEIKHIRITR